MNLSLRFLVPIGVVLTLIAYLLFPLADHLTLTWFKRDIDIRSRLIANTVRDGFIPLLKNKNQNRIQTIFDRMIRDERLYAVGFCDPELKMGFKTETFPKEVSCQIVKENSNAEVLLNLSNTTLHISSIKIEESGTELGYLILIHDMGFVKKRSADTRWYIFYLFLLLGVITSFVTVSVAHISWYSWTTGIQDILRGRRLFKNELKAMTPEMRPILTELRTLIRDLESDKRTRDDSQISWTAKTLKEILRNDLAGDEILIVSNREPYIDIRRGNKIEVQYPASGLVTALEPIMRACSGTWIAHGSGNADKEVVDEFDRVKVPPENPSYTIRRVWLTPEEEEGYYYGFANEGVWPLCHIAHARPIFRNSDWNYYTRFHCNNFLETVDRYLESRIDRETWTVSYKGDLTAIRHYPISIEWPPKWLKTGVSAIEASKKVKNALQLDTSALLGVGFERLDYTKGIPEKFRAVERLLEKYPKWIGKFFFVQIAAPSRAKIPYYQSFFREVVELSEFINQKYKVLNYQPIRLILEHHEPEQVFEYFRASNFCFVNSLHDGMNLVAKEFISSREDERGVLILSQFTGASRELPEAIIVNPYNIEQCAEAMNTALEMKESEQRDRMRNMRGLIMEYNVYRWAGRMLNDGARIRQRNRFLHKFDPDFFDKKQPSV